MIQQYLLYFVILPNKYFFWPPSMGETQMTHKQKDRGKRDTATGNEQRAMNIQK